MEPNLSVNEVQLRLDGDPVPYLLVDGPDGPGLSFFASHAPSRHASWTTYRLDLGQGAGESMETTVRPDTLAATSQDSAWTTLWLEQDLHYRPQIRAPEPWFWQPILSQGSVTHTVELTQALTGPITLTVRLWSREAAESTASAPRIRWQGEEIGAWQWNGADEQNWTAHLTSPSPQGEYVLEVEMPEQPDGSISRVWLDGWGVTYRRPMAFSLPGIAWTAESDEATIPGADGARLLDVTDPGAALDLGDVDGEQIPTQPGRRYWMGFPWMAPNPIRARSVTTIEQAALASADYVIIAPEPFWEALQPLVEHRESQGLRLLRLTPTQVYDAYGDGRPDPAAIRALVQDLHSRGQLRYLLLVGDASTQPDDYAGEKGAALVVTDFAPTAHLYETPSDQAMITGDGGQALVAVGRFPAETAEQVETMVDKTIQWEGSGLSSALIMSDDEADFGRFADRLGPSMPIASQRLDAGEQDARPRLLEELQEPGTWLNYVGHGSLALWGDERLLQRDDQWSEPAALTVWACLSGYFVHPKEDSMAEVWLRSAQGGAVVFVGPTGETYLHQQQPLAQTFYQEIQAGQRVGDALLAAWQNAGDGAQDAVRSYLLLGDPALKLYSP
jgi:hypothetical protein